MIRTRGLSSQKRRATMRAKKPEVKVMAEQERWGVWITQARPRKGQTQPDAYWWQGPDYYGDCLLTRREAEDVVADMQKREPTWSYEAKPYAPVVPRRTA